VDCVAINRPRSQEVSEGEEVEATLYWPVRLCGCLDHSYIFSDSAGQSSLRS